MEEGQQTENLCFGRCLQTLKFDFVSRTSSLDLDIEEVEEKDPWREPLVAPSSNRGLPTGDTAFFAKKVSSPSLRSAGEESASLANN